MLIPLIVSEEEIELDSQLDINNRSSKTYKLDLNTGEIMAEFIDYEAAVRQAVVKSVMTRRDKYMIYSTDYGCEIEYLIGETYSKEYLELEIPRLVEEALMLDDRVDEIVNYEIERVEDKLYVSFQVLTDIGEAIEVEVEL